MSNKEMVQSLVDAGHLKNQRIIDAFENTDRADFVRPEDKEDAYEDRALPIEGECNPSSLRSSGCS